MAYDRNLPFNELPPLPTRALKLEKPEKLHHLIMAFRHIGELNDLYECIGEMPILKKLFMYLL
jgi:hypothetical protein